MNITKERRQQIYIAVVVISLLVVVGGIYRLLRQKHQFRHSNYKFKKHAHLNTSVASLPEADIVDIHLLPDTTPKPLITQPEDIKNLTTAAGVKIEIAEDCLHCLCITVNGCKPTKCSKNRPCGIYEISKYYWTDGGRTKTTDNLYDYNETDEEERDYLRCVNNEKCAKETVNKYMQLYQRDCNNDGIIDCQDYIALHLLGPSGCRSRELKAYHKLRMDSCLK